GLDVAGAGTARTRLRDELRAGELLRPRVHARRHDQALRAQVPRILAVRHLDRGDVREDFGEVDDRRLERDGGIDRAGAWIVVAGAGVRAAREDVREAAERRFEGVIRVIPRVRRTVPALEERLRVVARRHFAVEYGDRCLLLRVIGEKTAHLR